MQALGQTVFTGTILPLGTSRCTCRGRGNVSVRAVAAPAKLDTRKSEQVCVQFVGCMLRSICRL